MNEGTNSISSWMEQQYLCLLATAPHPGAALFVPLTQKHQGGGRVGINGPALHSDTVISLMFHYYHD